MKIAKWFVASFLLISLAASVHSGQDALAAGSAVPVVSWTRFQDPYEHAFSIEVPQGWIVKGGLLRLGYSDVRPMIDMTSPDGRTSIRLGDVTIPSYAVPNPSHPKEGEPYDLGAQAQMTVAKYRSGEDFARLYALQRFPRLCQKLEPQPVDSNPPVRDYVPPGSPAPSQSSGGQVSYRCESPQGTRVAYVYAKTALFNALWQVTSLASFIAPSQDVPEARDILLHVSQSFQASGGWMELQKQMDAQGLQYQRSRQQQRMNELSQQMQQFEERMHAMQNQVNAFERRQSAQAAQVESFTNTLSGIQPTTDPLGNERNVWIGPKDNYWVNSTGTVINSNLSPGAGWQQLKPHD